MQLRSITESKSVRYTMARGRVLLYGKAVCDVRMRRHKNNLEVSHICAAVRLRLWHRIARVCRQTVQENRLPAHTSIEPSGPSACPRYSQTDRRASDSDIAQHYKRISVGWHPVSMLSECVQDVVAQLEPFIAKAIRNNLEI